MYHNSCTVIRFIVYQTFAMFTVYMCVQPLNINTVPSKVHKACSVAVALLLFTLQIVQIKPIFQRSIFLNINCRPNITLGLFFSYLFSDFSLVSE